MMHSSRSSKSDILPRPYYVGSCSWHSQPERLPLTKSPNEDTLSMWSFNRNLDQPVDEIGEINSLDLDLCGPSSDMHLYGQDQRTCTRPPSAETRTDDRSICYDQLGNVEMLQSTEVIDSSSFINLASMNVNTNGKNTWGENLDMIRPETESSKACMKKIKCINMGEVPLKPVGFSLSGSGMQLYVKMGSKLKKPIASRSRKPRTKTNVRANLQSTMTQTANLPIPVSRNHKKNEYSCERNIGITIPVLSKLKVGENHVDLPPPQSKNVDVADVVDVAENCSVNWERGEVFRNGIKDEPVQVDVYPPSKRKANRKCQKRVRDCSPNNPRTSDSATKIPATDKVPNRAGTQPMISGPSWTFENGKIDVDHCPRTNRRCGCRDNPERIVLDEPTDPSCFTSNDLPLRRPLNQSKGFRKNHSYITLQAQHGKHSKMRHHAVYGEIRNPLELDYENPSSDDDDDLCEVNSGDKDKYKMNNCPRKVKNVSQRDSNVSMEPLCRIQNKKIGTDASEISSLVANDIVKTESNDFDSSKFPPSVLDAITLEKFTEYTQNMRKDLKQNYKNLSHLMKDFNHKVLERNNNKCSQCHSSINDSGQSSSSSSNNKKQGSCLLM